MNLSKTLFASHHNCQTLRAQQIKSAISAAFLQTRIPLCIVQIIRNALKYVSWKDYKAVVVGLKQTYQAETQALALQVNRFMLEFEDRMQAYLRAGQLHKRVDRILFLCVHLTLLTCSTVEIYL